MSRSWSKFEFAHSTFHCFAQRVKVLLGGMRSSAVVLQTFQQRNDDRSDLELHECLLFRD